jgi:hypothetical protein
MNQDMYTTKDFYLTAYILAMGCEMISHEKRNGVTIFSFNNTNSLQQLVARYYSLQAVVNPVAYGNSIRTLKSIIYADGNSNVKTITTVN